MNDALLHLLNTSIAPPDKMPSPFDLPPHPIAQLAAQDTVNKVHAYMRAHPTTELHRCGKMFGVLVIESDTTGQYRYLRAFSGLWDGEHCLPGFVPPVGKQTAMPIGHDAVESKRLQQLVFAGYNFINGWGESRTLTDIFADEKSIVPIDDWFRSRRTENRLPPSGAGDCCAPKLLQYALTHGWKPLAMAEFWVGASPKNDIRHDGSFYPPCSSKCKPILRHVLQGISIAPSAARVGSEKRCEKIECIFEDDYLLVVNKPSGLLSVPGKTDDWSATEYVRKERNIPYLQAVHRLDQDTSGLLVCAKTADVYKTMQAYFQRRDVHKRYEALILPAGKDTIPDQGTIALPLLPNPLDRPRQMVHYEHGKTAITDFCVRARRTDGTIFIDFYPRTGRTHQLRIHAAHPDGLNAPIVGDRLYAPTLNPLPGLYTPTPNAQVTNSKSPMPPSPSRLMLHAAEISFPHPFTSEEMHFCIPSNF